MQMQFSMIIANTHCGRVDRVFGIFALRIPQHMREVCGLRQSGSNRACFHGFAARSIVCTASAILHNTDNPADQSVDIVAALANL
jgi:hypothetical protein